MGFEPTTSGSKTFRSWGRQRPRLTARLRALVSCWRNRVPRPSCPESDWGQSLLDDGPAWCNDDCALIITFHSRPRVLSTVWKCSTDVSCLYCVSDLRIVLRLGKIWEAWILEDILLNRKYCRMEVTFATRLVVLALSKSTMHGLPVWVMRTFFGAWLNSPWSKPIASSLEHE